MQALKHLLTKDYGKFLDSVFTVIDTALQLCPTGGSADVVNGDAPRFSEYMFRIAWEVLASLPPSLELVESLRTEHLPADISPAAAPELEDGGSCGGADGRPTQAIGESCARLLSLSLLALRMTQPRQADLIREHLGKLEPHVGELYASQLRQRLTQEGLISWSGQLAAAWMDAAGAAEGAPRSPPQLLPLVLLQAATAWQSLLLGPDIGKEKEEKKKDEKKVRETAAFITVQAYLCLGPFPFSLSVHFSEVEISLL